MPTNEAANMDAPGLFSSIPRTNTLGLFDRAGRPDGHQITDFLCLKTRDVAKATRLSPTSVRYDLRMPEALEGWLREIATAATLVAPPSWSRMARIRGSLALRPHGGAWAFPDNRVALASRIAFARACEKA